MSYYFSLILLVVFALGGFGLYWFQPQLTWFQIAMVPVVVFVSFCVLGTIDKFVFLSKKRSEVVQKHRSVPETDKMLRPDTLTDLEFDLTGDAIKRNEILQKRGT